MTDADEVAAVLTADPGRTAGEVREALRSRGRVSITAADVAQVLRRSPTRFTSDGGEPLRWGPVGWLPSRGGRPRGGATGSSDRLASGEPTASGGGRPAAQPLAGQAPPGLYRWQVEALDAWRRQRCRGVVEAVTGTGKTMIGVVAAVEELGCGGQVCILVPTRELLYQWRQQLTPRLPAGTSLGLLGAGQRDDLGHHDVLVAIVNSARDADLRPRRPGGLLVADECHRYGSEMNRLALAAGFARRLGLSATYARADGGNAAWLEPYFGGTCFRMGYRRAIADGVTARFTVALVGVRFDDDEQVDYDELTQTMANLRARLIAGGLVPAEPVGAFLDRISRLARGGDDGPAGRMARSNLLAMQDRRRLLAETPAKAAALAALWPTFAAADRAIVFTQSIAAADGAAAQLSAAGLRSEAIHSRQNPLERSAVLARFAEGDLDVVTAPQVLDEGVDVPVADLAVILAASRSRRQMIQRMGRVLRRKPDGRLARFVVVSVQDTVEDPALGAHEGFLEEVTAVADRVAAFPPGTPGAEICTFVNRLRPAQ